MQCEFNPVERCTSCGGQKIHYRVIVQDNGCVMTRFVCEECGYSQALAQLHNLTKRTNTPLNNWSVQVRKRDDCRCRICGSEDGIEAHHIIPVSHDTEKRFMYDINNGITLCKRCHSQVHRAD